MKKIKILTMLMALVAFTSCYNDEVADNQKADTSRPIVLSSALEKSRAVTQDEQIVSGQYVYAWADVASTQASWFNRWLLTANGSGAFTCESGTEKYFPKGNAAIDIYAIHGRYQFAENAAFPSDGYTFSVHNDQSSTVNYCESDLLYGIKKGATYDAAGVDVKFYHMLSKLEVVLKAGGSLTDEDLENAEVNILGVQTQVTFTPEKTTEAGIADSPTRGGMLTLATESQAAKAAIIMNTVVAPKANTGFGSEVGEACIPPQSFDTDQFIKIVLHSTAHNGTTLYVPLHNLTMNSGYKYTFQVSVNSHLAVASVAVTPWGTETQNVIDMNVASEDRPVNVGDYLFSDGSWGPYTEGTATASHYPIAVIFSNTTSLTDQAAGYRRGYAVALASCGAQLTWAKTGTIGVNTQVHPTLTNSLELAKANLDGRTETNRIKTLSDFSKENYPSAYYATHFGTSEIGLTSGTGSSSTEASGGSAGYAAPANTSGWYLGSIGQYYLVAKNLGGNIDNPNNSTWTEGSSHNYWYVSGVSQANKNALEAKFAKGSSSWAPYTTMPWMANKYSTWYWTSSEFSASNGFLVTWDRSGSFGLNGDDAKSYTNTANRGVRPVIAF